MRRAVAMLGLGLGLVMAQGARAEACKVWNNTRLLLNIGFYVQPYGETDTESPVDHAHDHDGDKSGIKPAKFKCRKGERVIVDLEGDQLVVIKPPRSLTVTIDSYRSTVKVKAPPARLSVRVAGSPVAADRKGIAETTLDARSLLLAADFASNPSLPATGGVAVRVEVTTGKQTFVFVRQVGTDALGTLLHQELARVASAPVGWAAATGPAPHPGIWFRGGVESKTSALNGLGRLADIQVVALSTSRWDDVGTCDFAEGYGGGGSKFTVKKQQFVEDVVVHEARTGAVLAQQSFRGSIPDCPFSLQYRGQPPPVHGTRSDEAESWLRSQ